MPYQITGTLKLPDGAPASNVDIEFISQQNYSPLLRDLSNVIRTEVDGRYTINIEYGEYAVRMIYGNANPLYPGKIFVFADTPAGKDLPSLLQAANFVPATPDYVKQIQEWLAEANAASAAASVSASHAKASEDRAKQSADSINPEDGTGKLMRVGGHAILDSERYSLERATGGRQTIIRDSAGNANCMFVLPRFRYEDLGMAVDMGSGDVTAFDFGSGSIKSEIFIGAYLASGTGAVSAPRQAPQAYLDNPSAKAACAAKGAGWHLMTVHEWAAVALWCMANGYEPIGNTNRGRSHSKAWLVGSRPDGRSPGDFSGVGSTKTGSLGEEASHDHTHTGIADMVGNAWELQDGMLLRSGQVVASTHNTQPEAEWAPQAAFLDAPSTSPVLSDSVTRTASVEVEWRSMQKSASYTSNQLLKRLLLEPSVALPKGTVYVNNEGERAPLRGGSFVSGAAAGIGALVLNVPKTFGDVDVGFRPVFA